MSTPLVRVLAVAGWAAILGGSACGWDHFDAVDPPSAVAPTLDAAGAPDVPDDDSPALTCTQDMPAVRQWTFDSSTQGWTLMTESPLARGTMNWTNATGNPTLGALEVDFSPAQMANEAFLEYLAPLGDLTGKVVSAWAWLDSGESPLFKIYVQTGAEFSWAENAGTELALHQWTCVSFNLAAPSFSFPGYDASDVVILGFEMLNVTTPFRLFVDTVSY